MERFMVREHTDKERFMRFYGMREGDRIGLKGGQVVTVSCRESDHRIAFEPCAMINGCRHWHMSSYMFAFTGCAEWVESAEGCGHERTGV